MNRHGSRFIDMRAFQSHAGSLKVRPLYDRELEFYAQHCLLLPMVQVRQPATYVIATAERGLGLPVTHPEHLTSAAAWLRLLQRHANGLHPYDSELGHNPFITTPDCSAFQPWEADETVTSSTPQGHPVRRRTITRYYSPWQVHVVELLHRRRYYYEYSRFLRHLDASHELRKRYGVHEDTSEIRSLRGMASGFDALERYHFANQFAIDEAIASASTGGSQPEPDRDRLLVVRQLWARRALHMSDVDEAGLFGFIGKLAVLIDDYRADERSALAEDAEQYLVEAEALARNAFKYGWEGFLAAAERHVGCGLRARLRRSDPVEVATDEAQANLKWIVGQQPVAVIAAAYDDTDGLADEIVKFCFDHDLWEVLYSLQQFSYTDADLRTDRFPGFFHRGLRLLALAVEQFIRAILEVAANCEHPAERHSLECPHGKGLRQLVELIGRNSSWLREFNDAATGDRGGDEIGTLEQRAAEMAAEATAPETSQDRAIAMTLAAAVATRNLVSHRSRFIPTSVVLKVGGACADAIVVAWLLARSRGLDLNGAPLAHEGSP